MKLSFCVLLVTAALASTAHSAFAQHEPRQTIYLAQSGGQRISMGSAMDMVQRQTGGRVLNAQEAQQNGRSGYRIKVLTRSGEVRVFFVDAVSGSIQQD